MTPTISLQQWQAMTLSLIGDGGYLTLESESSIRNFALRLDETTIKPLPVPQERPWSFPVGSEPEAWYAATRHLDRGSIWGGGVHTGIDYNLDRKPYGDVELGYPTFAVADGVIHGTWHSEANLGSIVYKVEHDGAPLWVRHWHLNKDDLFLAWQPGMVVRSGQPLGHLGDYPPGPTQGAHLHFDMCVKAFHPGVWWSNMVPPTLDGWLDPVAVLKAHLDPATVEASLKRGQ